METLKTKLERKFNTSYWVMIASAFLFLGSLIIAGFYVRNSDERDLALQIMFGFEMVFVACFVRCFILKYKIDRIY